MKTTDFDFDTRAEAVAFTEGVEFVNDSAITAQMRRLRGHKHRVTVTDKDGTPDEPEEAAG